MIWLKIYVGCGLIWCLFTFAGSSSHIEVSEHIHKRGGLWWMVALNFILWPFCVVFNAVVMCSPKLISWLLPIFRRRYIDGERVGRSLRPQMPQLGSAEYDNILNAWWSTPAPGQRCLVPDPEGYAKAMAKPDADNLVDFTGVDRCSKMAVVAVTFELESPPTTFSFAYCWEHRHPIVGNELEGCYHRWDCDPHRPDDDEPPSHPSRHPLS